MRKAIIISVLLIVTGLAAVLFWQYARALAASMVPGVCVGFPR
jgi:Flp pilus assembly protein CpaB